MKKKISSFQGNTPNFLRPSTQGKRQHKDMKFWNWGPTTIWHNMTCGQNCFQKSLHPIIYPPCLPIPAPTKFNDYQTQPVVLSYIVPAQPSIQSAKFDLTGSLLSLLTFSTQGSTGCKQRTYSLCQLTLSSHPITHLSTATVPQSASTTPPIYLSPTLPSIPYPPTNTQ